ncbi:protein O-linked-mannose beta-1,2-N-acetylglucosaminyltransferase 1-like isoform X2 [Panulirus ornatus]|uniref:protein O-linked-mannose beta-1,2-N-acetylglucosaminyltransferase 1-like isoform X2 n=1 Tax=Panulirus ornatus TaxID=150431 RepID=UPI003A86CD01
MRQCRIAWRQGSHSHRIDGTNTTSVVMTRAQPRHLWRYRRSSPGRVVWLMLSTICSLCSLTVLPSVNCFSPRSSNSSSSPSSSSSSSSPSSSSSSSSPSSSSSRVSPSGSGMIGVRVWSSFSGWGVTVEGGCRHHHHILSCNNTTTSPADVASLGVALPRNEDQQPHQEEGITLTVLNQRQPTVIFNKVFPLGQYWAHWADLEWHLSRVAAGRIVVMTVAVSGTVGLRHAAHQLAQLGSLFALHLTPLAHWTWVFVKGGRTISETTVIQGHAPHHAHLILPLSLLPIPSDNNSYLQHQRWQYCAAHGAMGGLCDEYSSDPLSGPTAGPVVHQAALAGVPVVVTAGNRYQYLYHTLTTLLAAPGAQHDNLLVVLGDAPPATTQLLRLINVNFTTLPVHGRDNNKLFRYYRSVFHLVAHTFPDAPAVILLDEDVQVSPDFFSFMSQTLWLLHADPTLYCINAHSITGFSDRAFNPSRVFRGDLQVQWGYAVTLEFVREALSLWPEDEHDTEIIIYDFWLYKHVRRGRECVYPEVGRALHYGQGTNGDALTAERAFLDKALVHEAGGVPLVGVERLQQDAWRQELTRNITGARALRGNPCTRDFLPTHDTEPRYVFFYRLDATGEGGPDVTQSFDLLTCVGGWGLSDQGQHEGVSIVPLSSHTTLYLVGVPYSSYSHLRPMGIPLWDINTIPEEEFLIVDDQEINQHKFNPIVANKNMTTENLMNILSTS